MIFNFFNKRPYARIEKKDHDFVIGATIQASLEAASPPEQDDTSGEMVKILKEEPSTAKPFNNGLVWRN